ncbi:unnamed protein product [Rhodiola kirilowii]
MESQPPEGTGKGAKIVYIWDMDETIILLKSLLNGSYAGGFNGAKDVQKGIEIGKMWEKHILQICDDHFFYEQVENYNSPSLDALVEYDDGRDLGDYDFTNDNLGTPADDLNKRKLAYRYRTVSKKYQQGLRNIVDRDAIREWNELYEMTDKFTDGWLSSARSFLEQCSEVNKESDTECQRINILVTSGSLIPSLVKCILFQLDDLFTHDNNIEIPMTAADILIIASVYSSWEVGKYHCFAQIKDRFCSPNVQFCVIGDGWEECEAAQVMKWPFIQIDLDLGSSHKFPGLTLKTVGHYISVIYGNSDTADADHQD